MRGIIRAALAGLALACTVTAAGAQAPPERLFSPEEARADFAALYAGLQSAHYDLYAFTPKADFDRAYAEQLAGFEAPMTASEAAQRFQRFAARARMGHTRIDYLLPAWRRYREQGGKGFPLQLRIVDGRAFVAEDQSGSGEVEPGDEVVALNGAPTADWLARAARNVSAESDYMAASLLEYDFAPLLWLELGAVEHFDLELRRGERIIRTRLPALTREAMSGRATPAPFDPMTREAKLLPGRIGYLRPGPFYNTAATTDAEAWDAAAFRTFIDDAFARFARGGADRILIDLRANPGGDNSFSDHMIAWFADRPFRFFSAFRVRVSPEAIAANRARIDADPAAAGGVSQQYAALYAGSRAGEIVDFPLQTTPPRAGGRFTGRVYLLVDRRSYSNTVNVAAIVQDYGFGAILGEATSDMATTYGAMERFTLPATGLAVGFPKAFIVRPSGDRRTGGVKPDIAIASPIVATADDPMLSEALRVVARGAGRLYSSKSPA